MPLRSQVLGGLRAAVYWRAERASHDLRMRYRRSGKYAPGPNRAELYQSRLSVSAQSLSATPEESNTLYLSGSWPVTSKLVCALGPQEMSSSVRLSRGRGMLCHGRMGLAPRRIAATWVVLTTSAGCCVEAQDLSGTADRHSLVLPPHGSVTCRPVGEPKRAPLLPAC